MLSIFQALLCVIVGAVLLYRSRKARTKRLPPGPLGYPLIGNVLDIPAEGSGLYFSSLKKKFGDVVFISIPGAPIIVLNSYQAMQDLLNKRGDIYSDRPRFVMAGEIIGLEKNFIFSHYGDYWRAQRRLAQSHLSRGALAEHYDFITKEAMTYIRRLHANPEQFSEEFRLTATRILLRFTYGIDIQSHNDPFVVELHDSIKRATEAFLPGRYLVDIMPWSEYIASLQVYTFFTRRKQLNEIILSAPFPSWLPFAGWKRQGIALGQTMQRLNRSAFDMTHLAVSKDTARPSFLSRVLQDEDLTEISDETKMWTSSAMYNAGADTTGTSLMRFFLAMCVYPDVQEKAAREIENVIGRDRLPTIADKDNLPYLDGVLKEIYRWHIVLPLAMPHRLMADDEYEGMHLPKGSTIVTNSWALANDPEMYPNPYEFDPERYVHSQGRVVLDPRQIAFGYGRRVCPGKDFAETVVWITIATILSTTRILRPLGADGKDYTPAVEFNGSSLSQPKPFKCRIAVRNSLTFQLAMDETTPSAA